MPPDESANLCRVLPIKYGLIIWSIIKTCLALGAFGYILLGIYYLFILHGITYNLGLLVILVILEIVLIVDICMSIMLIVGEIKKNYKLVKVYFRYATYTVVAAIVVITVYTTYELTLLWGAYDSAPWRELRTFKLADVVKLATIGTIYVLIEVFAVYLLSIELTSLRAQRRLNCKDELSLAGSFFETENT